MKKILISLIILFLTGFVLFFFLASRPNLLDGSHFEVINYNQAPSDKVPDTVTAMTYNIGYFSGMTNNLPVSREYELFRSNMNAAVDLIKELDPHILGIQEVDLASSRSFEQNQLDSLALKNGFSFGFKSINWDKRYVPFPYWPVSQHFGKVVSGQGILSQFPISNDTTIKLIKPVNSSFIYDAFYLDRLIQVCDVKVGPTIIKVINVHLEAFDEATREQQAYKAKALFERFATDMPVIMLGDFNSRPPGESESSEAMKVIMQAKNIASAISKSAYHAAPVAHYTFSSSNPYQMIDYILFNDNFIEKTDGRVVQEAGEISDHLPVVMKFVLKKQIEEN